MPSRATTAATAAGRRTSEGHEITFATHLLNGSYLLTSLALPLLRAAAAPRVIFVSSGGMYNAKFPGVSASDFAAVDEQKASKTYNRELAYAHAKRGQVLLAEQFSERHADVAFVSCHPGWSETPGVDDWLGASKVILQPMRSLWQGVEGIAWLCAADRSELDAGAFYLDRTPRTKHLAGPFFTCLLYTSPSPRDS